MFEELRRLVMIGIGGTALAVDKVAEYVDELVEQGKLTFAEGKKLTEELIRNKKKDTSTEERAEIEQLLLDMNLAQRKDIETLESRIAQLEAERDMNNTNDDAEMFEQ